MKKNMEINIKRENLESSGNDEVTHKVKTNLVQLFFLQTKKANNAEARKS